VSAGNWESVALTYSDINVFDQEFLDFLSSQKHVKHIVDEAIPQPRMMFYMEGEAEAQETLFVSYVPLSMTKDIMKEKGLLKSATSDDL
jgi:hypothetical protein